MNVHARANWGRLGALLLPLLLASPLARSTPAHADAARWAPVAPASTVTLGLLSQTPWVAPNGVAMTKVSVQGAPTDARIQVVLHRRVADQSALDATHESSAVGAIELWQEAVPLDAFAHTANGGVEATLATGFGDGSGPADGRAIVTSPGVFPIVVRVLGTPDDQVLASLVTYVVRLPSAEDEHVEPLRVAPLVTVDAPPSRSDDSSVAVTDATRSLIRRAVVALGTTSTATVPVALAATPEVLESLRESSNANDERLLSGLAGVLADREVVRQPYVQIDLPSWVADPALEPLLPELFARGDRALDTTLHAADDRSLWVDLPGEAQASLSDGALAWLHARGVTRVVLPSSALTFSSTAPPPALPVSLATPGGSLTALATDDHLQVDLQAGGALGASRVLADLALRALDGDGTARGVVLPASASDPGATSLPLVLSALAQPTPDASAMPLLEASRVGALFALPLATTTLEGEASPVVAHLTTGDATPPHLAYASRLSATASRVGAVSRMLGPDVSGVRALWAIVDSAGARDLPEMRALRLLDAADSQMANTVKQITLPPQQTITLTARDGVVPLTIRSTLPSPATVTLHLQSNERVTFLDGNVQTIRLTGDVTHLRLRVRTRTPGDAHVNVVLTSPDGGLQIADTRLTIRSTAMSGVGLVISAGALLVLLTWWVRHGLRARRARRL